MKEAEKGRNAGYLMSWNGEAGTSRFIWDSNRTVRAPATSFLLMALVPVLQTGFGSGYGGKQESHTPSSQGCPEASFRCLST
jgi:hypothetical protein